MKKIIALVLLSLSITVSAQQKTRFDKIDSLLTYLNQNHKFMGQICLREAGKVVFCEKPMANTLVEAEQMLAAVRAHGVINMLCHNYRRAPAIA
ncbi:MAG: Gfo/Idh/MocA family oxidoreductase, partial [Flavobacterium sp.]